MKLLAINTLGEGLESGVWEDTTCLAQKRLSLKKGHDEFLPDCVSDVLGEAGIAFTELDAIAIVAGPGSFTSVRVGVAYARGLGVALDIPVLGVSSLEAALPKDKTAGRVMVALPAKRRPPELTWWTQTFTDATPQGDAKELDIAGIQALAKSVDLILAADPAAFQAATGLTTLGTTPALENVITQALKIDREKRSAAPQYVRAPDAIPMKPA